MVARPLKRIPRLPCASVGFYLLVILLAHHAVSNRNFGAGNNFFAAAFSLPKLARLTQQKPEEHHGHQPQDLGSCGRIRLSAAIPFYATDVSGDRKETEDKDGAPAFLIESISESPVNSDRVYKTIANLCIDVFFKELLDPSGQGNVNLLKSWQINYLKNLQSADLERRRRRNPDTNEMFLAYEIRKSTGVSLSQPLLMDEQLKNAFNLKTLSKSLDREKQDKSLPSILGDSGENYVKGDLLGFVEITQRPYGLGGSVDSTTLLDGFSFTDRPMRPILTNLAVVKAARQYGIGSLLLEACEEHVVSNWRMNEIVLEVEDYNARGLEFYRQRGYEVLFSDPASRRYDIRGLWLNKVRCRRDIMRKALERKPPNLIQGADNLLRRIRATVQGDQFLRDRNKSEPS